MTTGIQALLFIVMGPIIEPCLHDHTTLPSTNTAATSFYAAQWVDPYFQAEYSSGAQPPSSDAHSSGAPYPDPSPSSHTADLPAPNVYGVESPAVSALQAAVAPQESSPEYQYDASEFVEEATASQSSGQTTVPTSSDWAQSEWALSDGGRGALVEGVRIDAEVEVPRAPGIPQEAKGVLCTQSPDTDAVDADAYDELFAMLTG